MPVRGGDLCAEPGVKDVHQVGEEMKEIPLKMHTLHVCSQYFVTRYTNYFCKRVNMLETLNPAAKL